MTNVTDKIEDISQVRIGNDILGDLSNECMHIQ